MTDFRPDTPPTLPPVAAQLTGLVLRHALTGLGAMLVGWGALDKDESATFTDLSLGLALAGAGVLWSVVSMWLKRRKFFEALDAVPAGFAPQAPRSATDEWRAPLRAIKPSDQPS